MKKLTFLLVIITTLLSCNYENTAEKTNITLNFKAVYNNEPIVMNQDFTYTNGKKTQFSRYYLYISEVELLGDNGNILLKDVDLLDFTNMLTADQANAGLDIALNDIPIGEYKGIKIGLGLSATQNAKKPSDANIPNVLNNPDNYWDGWQSYIFSKTEGRMDLNGNGQYTRGFAYHTGSNEVFREKIINKTINITSNNTLKFTIDLAKTLNGVNLAEDDGTHVLGDVELSNLIMDNLKSEGFNLE